MPPHDLGAIERPVAAAKKLPESFDEVNAGAVFFDRRALLSADGIRGWRRADDRSVAWALRRRWRRVAPQLGDLLRALVPLARADLARRSGDLHEVTHSRF